MLSDDSKAFTKENINLFFRDLSKEYKKLGGKKTPVEIILIGGAAIIESYGFREMTTDIDAVLPDVSIMKEAINRVGDMHDLPNGWLNADFMKTASWSLKLRQYSVAYRTFNQVLNVRMITGEYLIAMKLRSGRQYKNDLSDIIGILAEQKRMGNPISMEQIELAVTNLYGGWDDFSEEAKQYILQILSIADYQKAYETVRNSEIQTSISLVQFQEAYPGILSQDNLHSVIENVVQRKEKRSSVLQQLQELKASEEKSKKKNTKAQDETSL